jgi:hypothetical protein
MATLTRKRKAISLETKYEIIQCAEMENEQKRDVAARFDILPNTLNTILKNKCNVTPICISRCSEKTGFSMSLTSGNAEMQENSDSDDENDDDIPLANLFNIRNRLDQIGFTTVDLVNVDSEVVSTKYKSDDDIIGDLLNKESDTDFLEIDDEPMEENVPTKFEGLQGLETVRCVLENHENTDKKLFSALAKIEQIFTSKQKQTDIASFFNKIKINFLLNVLCA